MASTLNALAQGLASYGQARLAKADWKRGRSRQDAADTQREIDWISDGQRQIMSLDMNNVSPDDYLRLARAHNAHPLAKKYPQYMVSETPPTPRKPQWMQQEEYKRNQPLDLLDLTKAFGVENLNKVAPLAGMTNTQGSQWLQSPVTTATPQAQAPAFMPSPTGLPMALPGLPQVKEQSRYATLNLVDPKMAAIDQRGEAARLKAIADTAKQAKTDYAKHMALVYNPAFGRVDQAVQQDILRTLDGMQQALGRGSWPRDASGNYIPPKPVPQYGAIQSAVQLIQTGADMDAPFMVEQGLNLLGQATANSGFDQGATAQPGVSVPTGGTAPMPVGNTLPGGGFAPPAGGFLNLRTGGGIPKSGKAQRASTTFGLDTKSKQLGIEGKTSDIDWEKGRKARYEKAEATKTESARKSRITAINKELRDIGNQIAGWKNALQPQKDKEGNWNHPPAETANQLRRNLKEADKQQKAYEAELRSLERKPAPKSTGGSMRYLDVAKRWAVKGGKRVVSDSQINDLVKGINYAKSNNIKPAKYGPQFRAAAEAMGYTKSEAARLFNTFSTQLGYR